MIVVLALSAFFICALSVFALYAFYSNNYQPSDCTWYDAEMCEGGIKCQHCPMNR